MKQISKKHNKLKQARPTGFANKENKKQKIIIKEKKHKTKIHQKTKNTINIPRHRPSNLVYQQRPINLINTSPIKLENLWY